MRIGEFNVPRKQLDRYVKHVVYRWLKTCEAARDEGKIAHFSAELERERTRLHDAVLDAIGLDRGMGAYDEFERSLQAHCTSMLPAKPPERVHKLVTPGKGRNLKA